MYRMFFEKFKEKVATTSSFLPILNKGVKPGAGAAILWLWGKIKGVAEALASIGTAFSSSQSPVYRRKTKPCLSKVT